MFVKCFLYVLRKDGDIIDLTLNTHNYNAL